MEINRKHVVAIPKKYCSQVNEDSDIKHMPVHMFWTCLDLKLTVYSRTTSQCDTGIHQPNRLTGNLLK